MAVTPNRMVNVARRERRRGEEKKLSHLTGDDYGDQRDITFYTLHELILFPFDAHYH